MRRWGAYVVFCLSFLLFAQRWPAAAQDPSNVAQSAQLLTRPTSRDVALQPGDDIQVTFFDTPELATRAQIAGDGTVKLPLVGDFRLQDLTPSEAAHAIDSAYQKGGFVLHPQSSVSITSFALNGVSITGEVAKPGVYPVSGHRTLLDIISLAGGMTSSADTRITIAHIDGTPESHVYLPFDDASIALKNDVSVTGGDKVVVQRAGTVYVLGEVGHLGGYRMLYDGHISVLQAIAQAEGTGRTAGTKAIYLIRRTSDGYRTERVPLQDLYQGKHRDVSLSNGDVLYVPFSNAKNFVFNAPQILGSLGGAAIYSVR